MAMDIIRLHQIDEESRRQEGGLPGKQPFGPDFPARDKRERVYYTQFKSLYHSVKVRLVAGASPWISLSLDG
jgi:hypothetical protein